MSGTIVDARGQRCPWPVLRLAKAMREADRVTILADDPQAMAEITALAAEHGWRVQADEDSYFVEKHVLEGLN